MKTPIELYQLLKIIHSDFGTQMMGHAKDLLVIIQNVLLKYCGAAVIKFIVVLKIKKFIALMERVIFFENLKNTVIG